MAGFLHKKSISIWKFYLKGKYINPTYEMRMKYSGVGMLRSDTAEQTVDFSFSLFPADADTFEKWLKEHKCLTS